MIAFYTIHFAQNSKEIHHILHITFQKIKACYVELFSLINTDQFHHDKIIKSNLKPNRGIHCNTTLLNW